MAEHGEHAHHEVVAAAIDRMRRDAETIALAPEWPHSPQQLAALLRDLTRVQAIIAAALAGALRQAAHLLLALAAACTPAHASSEGLRPVDDCGIVEVNTVVELDGRERFTQVIYRDHVGRIRDWRMLRVPEMIPQHGVAVWDDAGTLRMVRCRGVVRTITTHDPEVDDRKENPPHRRRRLVP